MRVSEAVQVIVTRRLVGALAVLFLALGAVIPAGAAQPIMVYMNHARILRLSQPVERVIIGNSNIADVTVADPRTIVLTGKEYGTTNLVLLGHDGNAIVDKDILVSTDEAHTIRVYRQTQRSVLSCGPNCEVDPTSTGSASKAAK